MHLIGAVNSKHALWGALSLAAIAVVVACACAIPASAQTKKLPVYCVQDDKKIAITFDAAWGADKTQAIVDELCRQDVKATFFLTGFWIDAYPQQTLYAFQHGMQLGNHSARHHNMGNMTKQQCYDEIASVNEQIYQLTGAYPTVFRAPFGDYGDNLLDLLEDLDMRCIQWDVDSLDWKGLSAEQLVKRVTDKCQGGSIILCHNNSDHILEALPTIITQLKAKGYRFVTVGQLLQGKKGTIDHTGRLAAE